MATRRSTKLSMKGGLFQLLALSVSLECVGALVSPHRSLIVRPSTAEQRRFASRRNSQSYEVEGDTVEGEIVSSYNRHHAALEDVGLDPELFPHAANLPSKRETSANDIFCNRELKMSGIKACGFDMDYTLAAYKQPAFDKLAFDGAKRKLVENFGYPEEVLGFEYDHTTFTRGLIIDTLRGNFLKVDRHKYCRVAYHGFQQMSSTTRKHLYSRSFNKVMSFTEKHFVNLDTLFQFVDAHLFALLIEMKDRGEHEFLDFKTYEEIYRELRESVDLCHRDGVIKDVVALDPEKYVVYDPGLVPMLQRFQKDGVKAFLLTNSLWEYTSTVMNYLYHGTLVDEETRNRNEWMELFDLVIVGSCKPAFLLDPYLNLFRVRPEDGSLLNTDGVYEIDALGENGAKKFLSKGKVFQGGNWLHLHALLEIEAGEEILYVGDHLYSDVLRSKRTLGWRSAFIMPELGDEIPTFFENRGIYRQITALRKMREELGLLSEKLRLSTANEEFPDVVEQLAEVEEEDRLLKGTLAELAAEWHTAFHPTWGAMFKAGYQDSRFAFYVQNYACLYMSKPTNLGLTSKDHSFRTGVEMLPHDRLLYEEETEYYDYDPWAVRS